MKVSMLAVLLLGLAAVSGCAQLNDYAYQVACEVGLPSCPWQPIIAPTMQRQGPEARP